MADVIRWGILGTGNIARKFTTALKGLPDAAVTAVGSRRAETAEAFGAEFGVSNRHGSYEALVSDPEVDAVYVSTPHPMHKDNSLLALASGKAVLCEKPFTVNAREAAEAVAVARSEGRFLMEAMWTRFLPAVAQARAWVEEGRIGEPRLVRADFGFRADPNPEGRLFAPALGGGGLLDVGCYVVSFASMVFGTAPERVTGLANLGETGVDEQAVMGLGYPGGGMAALTCAVRTTTTHGAHVYGTDGMIHLPHPFWSGTQVVLEAQGAEPEARQFEHRVNGYEFQALEVADCLRAGRLESGILPLDESVRIMETLDELRAQWGLTYPVE